MTQSKPVPVDIIVHGGPVLTMDPKRTIHSCGAVAIRGQEIVAVGPAVDVLEAHSAERMLDCGDSVIMPGLVNTHTHLSMSLLRGLADDLRLDVWLHGYILPVEREFANPEFCFLGTQLACAEMLRGGTTCFADMYYHEQEVAWAAAEAGMRGICGETVMKLPTPDAGSYEESLRYCQGFLDQWKDHERIVAAPAPHSLYMTTPDILRQTTALAQEYGVPQLIHVSETRNEVDEWVAQTSMRPVRWLDENGVFNAKTVAAHCVHVNAEEMVLLARRGVGVAHNPTSNLKLASGIAPVAAMLERGLNVGIGTDGSASNNDLDMFEETRLAALLPKGIGRDPTAVPAVKALEMATIGGARALYLDHLTGSIEVGKRADIIVIDLSGVHAVPQYETTGFNVYSQLVYTAKSCDVRHVFVDGRQLVADGNVTSVDVPQVIMQATALGRRINRFFVGREASVFDKLIDIGELQQQETFEVQAKGLLQDASAFQAGIRHPDVHVTGHTSRDQFDTYLLFGEGHERLRYREDHVFEPDGSVSPIYSLTLTGPAREAEYADSVVLSRARYAAPSTRSLRFYREYFQPRREREISKHRERYHIRFRGLDFAVNLDRITNPEQDSLYVEIKSRTWSQQDAVKKAGLISELLSLLGAQPEDMLQQEYVDLFDGS